MKYIVENIYHTWENFGGGKLANLVNHAKFSSPISRCIEDVFGIYTDISLFAKFFLANSFYLYAV